MDKTNSFCGNCVYLVPPKKEHIEVSEKGGYVKPIGSCKIHPEVIVYSPSAFPCKNWELNKSKKGKPVPKVRTLSNDLYAHLERQGIRVAERTPTWAELKVERDPRWVRCITCLKELGIL